MTRFVILIFFVSSGVAWASPVDHEVLCKPANPHIDSEVSLNLFFEGRKVSFENLQRGCRSMYVYKEASDAISDSLILSYPTADDMGLNAQVLVFAVSARSDLANYIGAIPAGASELPNGSYKDIQQSGGSIYETIYRIEGHKILISRPTKELIIADEKCVYRKKTGGACQKMRGSFKKPVCIFNYDERKVLIGSNECADMRKNF